MQKDKTPLHLRILCIQSFIALVAAIVLPIASKSVDKDVSPETFLPFLFAGLIGISAHEISSRLHKRVIALENELPVHNTDSD